MEKEQFEKEVKALFGSCPDLEFEDLRHVPSQSTTVGSITTSEIYPYYDKWWDQYKSCFNTWYVHPTPNKVEQSFKVAKVLMDQKLVQLRTVKQFLDLMDKLMEVL